MTEKEYFERLVDLYGLRGRVVIDKGAAGRDPKTLVERAADLKAKEDKEAREGSFDSWGLSGRLRMLMTSLCSQLSDLPSKRPSALRYQIRASRCGS